jgi:hypothetical protein
MALATAMKKWLEEQPSVLGVILGDGTPEQQKNDSVYHIEVYSESLPQEVFEFMYRNGFNCVGVDMKNYDWYDGAIKVHKAIAVSFKKL